MTFESSSTLARRALRRVLLVRSMRHNVIRGWAPSSRPHLHPIESYHSYDRERNRHYLVMPDLRWLHGQSSLNVSIIMPVRLATDKISFLLLPVPVIYFRESQRPLVNELTTRTSGRVAECLVNLNSL